MTSFYSYHNFSYFITIFFPFLFPIYKFLSAINMASLVKKSLTSPIPMVIVIEITSPS